MSIVLKQYKHLYSDFFQMKNYCQLQYAKNPSWNIKKWADYAKSFQIISSNVKIVSGAYYVYRKFTLIKEEVVTEAAIEYYCLYQWCFMTKWIYSQSKSDYDHFIWIPIYNFST
jgi:hypothetical protein